MTEVPIRRSVVTVAAAANAGNAESVLKWAPPRSRWSEHSITEYPNDSTRRASSTHCRASGAPHTTPNRNGHATV